MSVKISDLLPEAREIPVGKGSLTINALDLQSITTVIVKHKKDIMALIASSKGGNPDYTTMIKNSPDLAADLIALSTGTVGQEKDIKRLPAASQLQALIAIWEVSVPDPKGLMSSLTNVFQDIQKELTPPAAPRVIDGKGLGKEPS